MERSKYGFIGNEPDLEQCRTVKIVDDLSRCLGGYTECMYAYPAGSTSTYCLHPDHKKFRVHLLDVPP